MYETSNRFPGPKFPFPGLIVFNGKKVGEPAYQTTKEKETD